MVKIAFFNWWSNGKDDFFRHFLENYMNIETEIDEINPEIIFFSLFSNDNSKMKKCNKENVKLRIFFTGEDTTSRKSRGHGSDHYFLNNADICLGFKYLNNDNYLRFPLWLTYINVAPWNMGKKCLPFDNAIHFKSNKASKCACIVSNHDSNHTRLQMVNELHEKDLIHCSGGLCKKNYKRIGSGKDEKGKQDCLHQFNFNISSESSISPGYISEKIFECIIGGCIPIYYCKEDTLIEPTILNNDFIIKYTNENVTKVSEKIEMLHKNPEKIDKFIEKGPLVENAHQEIIRIYDELKNKILQYI